MELPQEPEKLEADSIETEEKSVKDFTFSVLKVVVALGLVVAMVYITGVREILFYQKTPPEAGVAPMERRVEEEIISLPVIVFLIREEELGSNRDKASVNSLIKNASNILKQGSFELELEGIVEREVSNRETFRIKRGNFESLDLRDDKINLILLERLGGPSGLAYSGRNTALVGDYTTTWDFRVLAHEIGHILGLGHTEESGLLMTQGAEGYQLTEEEIEKMRKKADEKF